MLNHFFAHAFMSNSGQFSIVTAADHQKIPSIRGRKKIVDESFQKMHALSDDKKIINLHQSLCSLDVVTH